MVIALTSDTLAVTPATTTDGNISQNGYIGYQVFDQYGVDISDKPLASSIQWTSGLGGTIAAKDGVLTLGNPGNMLITQFTTTVITAVDPTSATSMNATVKISLTQGTLSSITLNSLTSPDNVEFTADATANNFYIDYTAKDVSGNDTKSYELVKNGLLYQNADDMTLYTSSPYITATVVKDPDDNTKAAIQVNVSSDAASLITDTPVTITAISASGTGSSPLTLTLKKAIQLDTFTLEAPANEVASGETVNIPFVAYDQNGNQLTDYTDFFGSDGTQLVTFSGGLTNPQLIENADGTASLQVTMPTVSQAQTYTLMAFVQTTGKNSSLNLTVQKAQSAATLNLGSMTKNMEFGKSQSYDYGLNDGGLTVEDQYGRTLDLTNGNEIGGLYYGVIAKSSDSSIISTSGAAYDGNAVTVTANGSATAGTKGTATITFELVSANTIDALISDESGTLTSDTTILDSRTATFSVVSPSDVVGYTLGDIGTIYNTGSSTAPTDSYFSDFNSNPGITGKLSNGASVAVNDPIMSASSNDSEVKAVVKNPGTDTSIYVYGVGGDDSRTPTISVVVKNQGTGRYYTATATGSVKTALPIAQSMGYSITRSYGSDNAFTGITSDSVTNTIKVDTTNSLYTDGTVFSKLNGQRIIKWPLNNRVASATSSGSWIYLQTNDQYGKNDAPISSVDIIQSQSTPGLATLDSDGTLRLSHQPLAGEYFTVEAGADGKMEVVKISFTGTTDTSYSTLLSNAMTKVSAYETLANGDLSTQALIDAANTAKAAINLTGLNTTDTHVLQTRITAADTKVAAAQAQIATATPTITMPTAGDTSVSGTAVAGASVILSVNGTAVAPVTAAGDGTWTVSGLTALASTDVISVTAQATGYAISTAATVTLP